MAIYLRKLLKYVTIDYQSENCVKYGSRKKCLKLI